MTNVSVLLLILEVILAAFFVEVTSYNRPPPREPLSVPTDSYGSTTPQQVHISMVGTDRMRITWITREAASSKVEYGTSPGVYDISVDGSSTTYEYLLYKSGQIHEAIVGPLRPNTVYYYRCSQDPYRDFAFKTAPAQLPINFVVIDYWQPKWDSFGRLVEPLASKRPWMVTQGNHEVEKMSIIHDTPFTSYNARWHMPFEESKSPSNLYYSFDVASEVHVIMLGSYTDFGQGSSQYIWLESDLNKVDRKKTPWVVVLVHAPWYSSNKAHSGEYESVGMRKAMEQLLYHGKVDLVFSGHVHAYERFTRVYNGIANKCGPVHITIGDGGNREGLATEYTEPKPEISIFREASFGHGQLQVVNSTHAQWTWHRNEDSLSIATDSIWLTTVISDPDCNPQHNKF
ncbi:probable purple acid phosphatase 20 isoform X2 [Spinacia oleracea]|uniref:Purple acid phosphatase n=1 Tax=Spinacia oleracea TaxID=3562 RepID=A0ABM3R668_SPIOL|nr:probable purple acid phosphatase 20 isoform X2 [Spinacia oleracea]